MKWCENYNNRANWEIRQQTTDLWKGGFYHVLWSSGSFNMEGIKNAV